MIEYVKTRYSDKFGFYKADTVIGQSLRLYGEYSQLEVGFLVDMLNQFSVVYDIGANIGYHTTAFASRAGHVYAFEPNPHNFAMLKQNAGSLLNVTLTNCAIGETNSIVKCSDFNPEIPGNFGTMHVGGDGASVEVHQQSIDSMNIQKPHLIKIDVEGSEFSVFNGCMKTIAECTPAIYYEAHETPHFKEIYELLEPLGYRFYWAQVMNYNPNNFANNIVNVFSNTALFSVLAWPASLPELVGMDVVDGPNDDHEKLKIRAQNKFNQSTKS